VAPSIVAEWKLTPGSLGPAFAAVLLGGMLGAFVFGYLADRFGRMRTLALCVLMFASLNIASAWTHTIGSFTIVRFLCGIGLGGAIPNVMALVSEYAPARKRNTLVALTWCGFALGAVLGGLISVPLIANFGWAAVFVAGGLQPLCTVPLILFVLPESIKFLILTPGNGAAVAEILGKISPLARYSVVFVLAESRLGHGRIVALLGRRWLRYPRRGEGTTTSCGTTCRARAPRAATLATLKNLWLPIYREDYGSAAA
jgi:AAHS family 4-hydroxybenzoate transporter-like MFS transporter